MPRPARPWFRFYVEAVHDRKLRRLKPEHRWLFVACLAAARQSPRPGYLMVGDTKMDHSDLADFAGLPRRVVLVGMGHLEAAGLVEEAPWNEAEGHVDCYRIPRWNERQYESDSSTERAAKHRSMQRRSNVATTPDATPPESETDTEVLTSSSEPPVITLPVPTDDQKQEANRRTAEAARVGRIKGSQQGYRDAVLLDLVRTGWKPEPTPQSALPDVQQVREAHSVSDDEIVPPPPRQGLRFAHETGGDAA